MEDFDYTEDEDFDLGDWGDSLELAMDEITRIEKERGIINE